MYKYYLTGHGQSSKNINIIPQLISLYFDQMDKKKCIHFYQSIGCFHYVHYAIQIDRVTHLPSYFHSTHCPLANLYSNRSFLLVKFEFE